MRTPHLLLALLACSALACQRPQRPDSPPAVAAIDAGGGGPREGGEACVDAWLRKKGLDAYGHPEGTMYAGGTPLFDERTGVATDRMTYVFGRHPELRSACPDAAPTDAGDGAPPALR